LSTPAVLGRRGWLPLIDPQYHFVQVEGPSGFRIVCDPLPFDRPKHGEWMHREDSCEARRTREPAHFAHFKENDQMVAFGQTSLGEIPQLITTGERAGISVSISGPRPSSGPS